MATINRYSSRSSYKSETSSINEADSTSQLNSSKFEAHNEDDEYTNNDNITNEISKKVVVVNTATVAADDKSKNNNYDDEDEDDDDIDKHVKKYQFERNTRLTSSIRNTKPQSASTPASQTRLPHNIEQEQQQKKVDDLQNKPSITKVVRHSKASAPVAPVAPLNVSTTYDVDNNNNNKQTNLQSPSLLSPLPLNDSFASIFTEAIEKQQKQQSNKQADSRTKQPETSTKSIPAPAIPPVIPQQTSSSSSLLASRQPFNRDQTQLNTSRTTMRKFENSFTTNDDDEDIDWASSDEEIVKQEIETFERNQVFIYFFNFFSKLHNNKILIYILKFFCYHAYINNNNNKQKKKKKFQK